MSLNVITLYAIILQKNTYFATGGTAVNITFLIGNGFDVGVGMNSKFKDFFPIYQVNSIDKAPEIRQLAENIGEDHETWADFESALGDYTEKFTAKTKGTLLSQVKDFEEEFISYLKDQENLLAFEENKKEIENVMCTALFGYVTTETFSLGDFESLNNLYKGNSTGTFVHNFINFNYTNVLKKCLKYVPKNVISDNKYSNFHRDDKIGNIVHVHGDFSTYPIIGVNDISQIKNKELASDPRFVKRFVKPTMNQNLKTNNDAKAMSLIDNSTIVCVYGMSFGKTDKKWWSKLIAWLSASSGRHLVIFSYDKDYKALTPYEKFDKEDSIIDLFDEYCANSSINIEKIRDRIHIAIHKNIFEIDLMKQHNEVFDMAVEKVLAAK